MTYNTSMFKGDQGDGVVVHASEAALAVQWWLIMESSGGGRFLEILDLSRAEMPPMVAQILRTKYYSRTSWVFSPHFDADIFPLRVTVSNKVLDETLNSGFYDPNSLQHATNFFATYAEFAITAPGAVDVPIRACMISPEINKYAVARFVFVALLVSVTAGVLAGFFTSRIDIGWALGGGMIALVAAFEMVFLWLLK